MIKYSIKTFSIRMKKTIIEFLSLFSLQERMLMSLYGVDPKTIYTSIKQSANCDDGAGFLLFKEDTLIGLATIYNLNRSVAVLGLLAVKPSEQRKGYGTFLLNYVLEVAKFNGIKEIRGKILKENNKIISFIKRFNFTFDERDDGDYLIRRATILPLADEDKPHNKP